MQARQELNGMLEEHPCLFLGAKPMDSDRTLHDMFLGTPLRNNLGLDKTANRPSVTSS